MMRGELLDEFAEALKKWRIQQEIDELSGFCVCYKTSYTELLFPRSSTVFISSVNTPSDSVEDSVEFFARSRFSACLRLFLNPHPRNI